MKSHTPNPHMSAPPQDAGPAKVPADAPASAPLPPPPQVQAQVVAVPIDLAEAVTHFLAQQPYAQVHRLIEALQKCGTFNVVENAP